MKSAPNIDLLRMPGTPSNTNSSIQESEESFSSETASSYYDDPHNREDLFLPLANHSLQFINEKEASNPKRYKRLKCCICKKNTHHRCVPCKKSYCKSCAFIKHAEMNPRFSSYCPK